MTGRRRPSLWARNRSGVGVGVVSKVGKSNTRIHESRAIGIDKESPTFILAIGNFLDRATNCACGENGEVDENTHQRVDLTHKKPSMMRGLMTKQYRESPPLLDMEEVTCWTLNGKVNKAIADSMTHCGIDMLDDSIHNKRKQRQRYNYDDDETIGSSSFSTDEIQDLHQAPTTRRRGMLSRRCHHQSGSSDQRDDFSMSRCEGSLNTELYEAADQRSIYSLSDGASITDTASTVLGGGDETTATFSTAGDTLTMDDDCSYDSSLAARANADTSFGEMLLRTVDMTADTGVDLLESLAEKLLWIPAASSSDSSEDIDSDHIRPSAIKTTGKTIAHVDQNVPSISKGKKVKNTTKFKLFTVSKVKSALQKVKLPKHHRVALQNRAEDIAPPSITAKWVDAAKRQLRRRRWTYASLAPARSNEKATLHPVSTEELKSFQTTSSSIPEVPTKLSSERLHVPQQGPYESNPVRQKRLSWPLKTWRDSRTLKRWRDSKPCRAAKVTWFHQGKDAQLKRLKIILGRLSFTRNTKDREGNFVANELVTVQCSNEIQKQGERSGADDYSFHRHSTTVSANSDASADECAIEVFLEEPSLSTGDDSDRVEPSGPPEDNVMKSDVDTCPIEPRNSDVTSSIKPTTVAINKPEWVMRIEHQSLRALCNVIALGSMRVKMTKKSIFRSWTTTRPPK